MVKGLKGLKGLERLGSHLLFLHLSKSSKGEEAHRSSVSSFPMKPNTGKGENGRLADIKLFKLLSPCEERITEAGFYVSLLKALRDCSLLFHSAHMV